jgi:hypothetical protein
MLYHIFFLKEAKKSVSDAGMTKHINPLPAGPINRVTLNENHRPATTPVQNRPNKMTHKTRKYYNYRIVLYRFMSILGQKLPRLIAPSSLFSGHRADPIISRP